MTARTIARGTVRCKALTKTGGPCGGYVPTGSEYCFAHDPALAEVRREARARGGMNSRKDIRIQKAVSGDLREVLDLLEDALRGVLAEIGYADALVARELPDGSLELIDGHLRAETTPDQEVPVLVIDVDEKEAAKLLAALDPLASLAESNASVLADLVAEVETESSALQAVWDDLVAQHAAAPPFEQRAAPPEIELPEAFQVVVECRDEADQRAVFERLTAEGRKCKLLTL